jgi:hypothetical protein
MRRLYTSLVLLASALVLPGVTGSASAHDDALVGARPMFLALPPHGQAPHHTPSEQLVQWNATFTDLTNKKHSFTMPGTAPSNTTTSTIFQVLVIPIKMVYGKSNGNKTFDPNVDIGPNGVSVTSDLAASPLFNNLKYVQGGTDVGTTQYIDAFQRSNFWYSVHKNGGGYHVLFNTSFMDEQTINVQSTEGSVINNPFASGQVGTMNSQDFDTELQKFMKSLALVNPTVLPLFVTDNIVLIPSGGSCCIGGYHSSIGAQPDGQTYSYSSYITVEGSFCQDVSCFAHELGEWMDDPFVDNDVGCTDNSIMEVGDPLVGSPNYGDYPYTLNGSHYNLQSLVFIGYFGGKPGTSLHSWLAFQNDMNHVCPGQ